MPKTNAFDGAARLLPERLRKPLLFLPPGTQTAAEELRLRCGERLCLTVEGRILEAGPEITQEDVRETLDRASRYSFHTVQESMKQGFLTAQGGYRIGLGGSVILRDRQVQGFQSVSSLNIRIPHRVDCISDPLFTRLRDRDVLICSPPGAGKTTFLRELVRRTSEVGSRVSLIDERGEIAALCDGIPQFDVGRNTDTMEFCPKTEAAELLLRTMNPQALAMDELTEAESGILEKAQASGVRIIATAHGESRETLRKRGIPTEMFDCIVHIRVREGLRFYELEGGASC